MSAISNEMKKSTETVRKPEPVRRIPDEIVNDISMQQEIPWKRRLEAAKSTMSEPRNTFEDSSAWKVDMPPHIKAHVRVNWLSDWIIQHKPIMPGFVYDSWKPVTPEVMKDFEITVHTDSRTPEGIPRVGMDAVLYWCPEDHAKQMDEYQRRGAHIDERLKTEKRRMKEQMEGMLIGNVKTGNAEEISEMEIEQRKELDTILSAGNTH